MVAAAQIEQSPAPKSGPGESASRESTGSVQRAMRGRTFAEQEGMLAPRAAKPGGGPGTEVQREEKAPDPEPMSAPAGALEERLGVWRPALVKATDPVAFMTEKSYNASFGTKKSEAGFFALAIAELERIGGELGAFAANEVTLGEPDRAELGNLAALAQGWKGLYATIRDTGDKPSDRDALTATALDAVSVAQTRLDALSPAVIGAPSLARMKASLDEIRTFVGSWSLLAASDSGAAKPMWASFLQVTERYRMILCEYGALEARGGDATGTGQLAVKGEKGMAKDKAAADKAAESAGGYQVLAMQTYSYAAANQAALKKQIDGFLLRVHASEFETLEAAQKAGRQEIGGGRASPSYYQVVDHYVAAAWHEVNGQHEKAQGDISTFIGLAQTRMASESTDKSGRALDKSKAAEEADHDAGKEGMREEEIEAWKNVEKYQQKAKTHQSQAEAYLNGANAQFDKATANYAESAASIETAKGHLAFVDPKRRPEFADAVSEIESGLDNVEQGLAQSEERLAEAKALRDQVAQRAQAQRAAIDEYDPKRMEVSVPKGLEGEELTTFVRGKLSVNCTIPGAPFLKITGSAESEGGVKTKKGSKWGYLSNDWSLGLCIDLLLFKIKGSYIAGSSVEAKDKLRPAEVLAAGEEERSNYAAKREIHDSGAPDKLADAFSASDNRLTTIFASLGKNAADLRDGNIKRPEYQTLVFLAANDAKSAQADLWGGVLSSFLSVSGLFDSLKQSGAILDSDEVYAKTLELGTAKAETAEQDVRARGDAFIVTNETSEAKTKEPMDQIADYSNDPNVTFSDYGGWKFGVEAGGGSFKVGAQYKHVTVTSDGEGKDYSFKDKTKDVVTLSVETGSFEGEISGTWSDGKFKEVGMSGTLRYDADLSEGTTDKIRGTAKAYGELFKKVFANLTDARASITALGGVFKDFAAAVKKLDAPKTEDNNIFAATPQLTLGFDLELGDKDTNLYLKLGSGMKASRTMSAGAFEVEAELTVGSEARFHVASW